MNYRELEDLTREIRERAAGEADESQAAPAESLSSRRRRQGRLFLGSMFLTLILLGGLFGFVLVENSFRQVGMGSLPQEVFSAYRTPEGIVSGAGLPKNSDAEPVRLARYADLAEPLLIPRNARVTVKLVLALLGAAEDLLF